MPLTLIDCYKQICTNINQKATKEEEKLFLEELKQQFDFILDQRQWFQSISVFSDTQSQLLEEAKAKYLISLNETYTELRSIQKKIKDKPGSLFKNLRESIQHQLDLLQKDRVVPNNNTFPLGLTKTEEAFYTGREIIFGLASQLGARYFPHAQEFDPLSGDDQGICAGDIIQWIDAIKKQGKSVSAPGKDLQTTLYQYEQVQMEEKYSVAYQYDFMNISDVWEVIEALSREIKPNFIYYLSLPAHALGVRLIPCTQEVEFRDPNFGTFVFKNSHTFKIFLRELLSGHYYSQWNGSIILRESARQKKESSASIPEVTNDIEPFSAQEIKNASSYACYSIIQVKAAKSLLENREDKAPLPKNNYHETLIKKTSNIFLKEIERLTLDSKGNENIIKDYNELLKKIETASPNLTLISLVDDWLKNKDSPSPFIKKLVRDYEICPAALFFLHDRLLGQITDMVNKDWSHLIPLFGSGIKVNGKKLPDGVANIRELLKPFYQGNKKDLVRLLNSICYAAKARLWTWQVSDIEIFYELLENLNPHNPSSLLETLLNLHRFTKDRLDKDSNDVVLSSNKNSLYYKPSPPRNSLPPSEQKINMLNFTK